jgi:nucleoredoxin
MSEDLRRLIGDTFLAKDGSEVTFEELVQNQVVALFFSAKWCPPCLYFEPMLDDFYAETNDPDKRLEIVFISSDKD